MDKDIHKYMILSGKSIEDLVKQVQDLLDSSIDWQPFGRPFVNFNSICQTMVVKTTQN